MRLKVNQKYITNDGVLITITHVDPNYLEFKSNYKSSINLNGINYDANGKVLGFQDSNFVPHIVCMNNHISRIFYGIPKELA